MSFSYTFVAAFLLFPLAAQNIQTIAGGGPRNLQALSIGFPLSSGIVLDASGNTYVSISPAQIWKIDTTGHTTVFAGNGLTNSTGDGGQAINATLNNPAGLALDSSSNLYFAESGGARVRKITPAGIITTVAGNGATGFAGDGGPATSAKLYYPTSVAIDALGTLYIADSNNHRIRAVSPVGIISTFAGNGIPAFVGDGGPATAASLYYPGSVAVDSTGTVYIGDSINYRIRKVVGGVISTFAGTGVFGNSGDGGPATSAKIGPSGVVVDPSDNLYVVEHYNIRLIRANQANITLVAGNPFAPGFAGDGGSPAAASFYGLGQLAFDTAGSTAYVTDGFRIRKITATAITTVAGNGSSNSGTDGQLATDAPLSSGEIEGPGALTLDNAGSLLFTAVRDSAIRKVNLSTGVLGTALNSVNNPSAIAFHPDGSMYYVENNRIRKLVNGVSSTVANSAGTTGFSGDNGPALAAQFFFYSSPSNKLALASNGDLYIADGYNNRVRKIDAQTGIITTIAGTGAAGISGDGGLATNATLSLPHVLSLDGAGHLYVGDSFGVRRITLSTNIIDLIANNIQGVYLDGGPWSNLSLSFNSGLFVDQSSNVFVSTGTRVVRISGYNSYVSTVAGNGTFGFSGDGGPATAAAINPFSITIDRNQNLYFGDGSGRIRSTKAAACFFTIGTPIVYTNSAGSTGSVTVTSTDPSCFYNVTSNSPFVTITSPVSVFGSSNVSFSITADPGQNRTATVNVGGATFNVQQAGALGQQNVGYFQPNTPTWALDSNGSGAYEASDRVFPFAGQPGAIAVTGDWNGDGRTKVGFYLNGFWVLDYNGNGIYDGTGPGGDKFYAFGGSGSSFIPVVGDWNGDGKSKIGYYNNGFWALDTNGSGTFDAGDGFFGYGGNGAGEIPLLGDWNGDKRTKIGYFYQGKWVLDYNGSGSFETAIDRYYATFPYALGDKPVTGDWTGDGKTKIGIFRNGFWILDTNNNGTYDGTGAGQDKFFGFGGNPGETPVVADWNGSGTSKIGIYNNGFWVLDFNGNGTYDGVGPGGDRFIAFGGQSGNQPLIGRW